MSFDLHDDVPETTCAECGKNMRLVGIEGHDKLPMLRVLTFECRSGHVATRTIPGRGH